MDCIDDHVVQNVVAVVLYLCEGLAPNKEHAIQAQHRNREPQHCSITCHPDTQQTQHNTEQQQQQQQRNTPCGVLSILALRGAASQHTATVSCSFFPP